MNLVEYNEEKDRKIDSEKDFDTITNDPNLKLFFINDYLQTQKNTQKYKLESEKEDLELIKYYLTIILSAIGLFFIINPFNILSTEFNYFNEVGYFLFLLVAIMLISITHKKEKYINSLFQSYNKEYVGDFFVSDLIKNFNSKWKVAWYPNGGRSAWATSKEAFMETYPKERMFRIVDKIKYAKRDENILRNSQTIIDLFTNKGTSLNKTFCGFYFFIHNNGFQLYNKKGIIRSKHTYIFNYHVYDHSGIIEGFQKIEISPKKIESKPELDGIYKIDFKFIQSQSRKIYLMILNKELIEKI